MRKIFLVLLMGGLILSFGGVADAESLLKFKKCSLIPTDNTSKEENHYINPKQISYLTILIDTNSISVGSAGRYVLIVTMTNGDNLLYGTYQTNELRKKAIKYLHSKVLICNQ